MNTNYRPFIESKEIIEGLKDLIMETQDAVSHHYFDDDDVYESLDLLKNASDEIKAEISQDNGVLKDYVLCLEFLTFYTNCFIPLMRAHTYLELCDINELIDNDVDDLQIVELPDWEQVFISLCKMPYHSINFYITKLDCNNEQKTNLLRAIKEKDSVSFRECVSLMGKESYLLIKVAHIFNLTLNTSFFPNFFQKEKSLQEDFMINLGVSEIVKQKKEEEERQALRKAFELGRLLYKENPDHFDSEMSLSLCLDQIKPLYHFIMCEYLRTRKKYIENRHRYSKEIQEIVDPYNVEPEKIDCYNELLKRGYSFDIPGEEGIFEELVIFGSKSCSDKSEYFNGIAPQIVAGGDDTFKEFVKYLADSGYIENTTEVKQLFTFRLTGKCRPKTEKLPKILWDGRSKNSPNELIYIIRYGTDNAKDKYDRMKDYFEGPKFPKNSPSSYSDLANIEFRKYLNELYPDVFTIKDISKY